VLGENIEVNLGFLDTVSKVLATKGKNIQIGLFQN
jgi:hypothetical protein